MSEATETASFFRSPFQLWLISGLPTDPYHRTCTGKIRTETGPVVTSVCSALPSDVWNVVQGNSLKISRSENGQASTKFGSPHHGNLKLRRRHVHSRDGLATDPKVGTPKPQRAGGFSNDTCLGDGMLHLQSRVQLQEAKGVSLWTWAAEPSFQALVGGLAVLVDQCFSKASRLLADQSHFLRQRFMLGQPDCKGTPRCLPLALREHCFWVHQFLWIWFEVWMFSKITPA